MNNVRLQAFYILIALMTYTLGTFSVTAMADCASDIAQYTHQGISEQFLNDLAHLMVEYQDTAEDHASNEMVRKFLGEKLSIFNDLLKDEPAMRKLRESGISDEDFQTAVNERAQTLVTPYVNRLKGIFSEADQKAIKQEVASREVENRELAIEWARQEMNKAHKKAQIDHNILLEANMELGRLKTLSKPPKFDFSLSGIWKAFVQGMGAHGVPTESAIQTNAQFQAQANNKSLAQAKKEEVDQLKKVSDASMQQLQLAKQKYETLLKESQ